MNGTLTEKAEQQFTQPELHPEETGEPHRKILIAAAYDFEKDKALAEYVPLIGRIADALKGIANVFATTRELPSGMDAEEKHEIHYNKIREADLILLHPKRSDDISNMVAIGHDLGKPFLPFYGEQKTKHQSMLRMLERHKLIFETVRFQDEQLAPQQIKQAVERFYQI